MARGTGGNLPRSGGAAQEAMVAVLIAAGKLLARLEKVCGAAGITHDQYNLLRILRGAEPEGLPRYAVADRLINRAPDVTRLLDRLEREGLVGRERSVDDRRLSIARITPRGGAVLERLDPEVLAVHRGATAPLAAAELRAITDGCRRLALP